jgi:L-iditol 2-dehydrogenase
VALHAVRMCPVDPAQSVAIVGCGAIGLFIGQILFALGVRNIFAIDTLAYRLDHAQRLFEPAACFDNSQNSAVATLSTITGGVGVDVVFEACGSNETFNMAFEAVGIGGKVALVGIPATDVCTFNPHILRRKELQIQNIRRSNQSPAQCLDFIREHNLDICWAATHRFPLTLATTALETAATYADGVIRAMVNV